jgi:hypothetical protein
MHNTTNNKGAPRNGTPSTPRAHYKQSGSFNKLSIALWRTAYSLEIARQDHADAGHLWRQAGCCIALSFFRMIGGRGV